VQAFVEKLIVAHLLKKCLLLRAFKVYCRVYKNSPLHPILTQVNPVHVLIFSLYLYLDIGKGKVIPLHAIEALGVRRGIAPTHS
jgi:hypothetical protein